ncbi:MAG TPA: glycosyltransferase family 4 protein [Flavobacteriaceae bacterium]
MERPLKIAIYSGAVPSTTFIERLIDGLASSGTDVYLFGIKNKRVSPRAHVHHYTYRNIRLSKLYQLLKYSVLLFLFKSKDKKRLDTIIASKKGNSRLMKVKYYPVLYHRPDIFHLQWAKSIDDWIWVQAFGMKLVVSLRGAHINYSPIANENLATTYNNLFPKVDRFHAVSKAIAKETSKYGAALGKIDVIYSGLPLVQLPYCTKENEGRTLFIISVGRSHWKKGYVHALDAMALLKNKGINFQYTIVGVEDPEYSGEELLFHRTQLNLEKEVKFLNYLPFEGVKSEIKKADVLLLSSVEEGIANVVLEAMALGTLVVTTDCGGMNEVIKDGENGFLVPIRNPMEMALTLQKVARLSLEDHENLTKAARKTVEQQHNIDDAITNMQSLYENVLSKVN